MSVLRMNFKDLSLFLASKGLSDAGQKSITDNEITGQMLLEFCEEDIQDAFSVFKDRFTIRKILREQKSSTDTQPIVISPTRLPTSTVPVQSSSHHKNYDQPMKLTHVPSKTVNNSNSNVQSNGQTQSPTRSVISLVKSESSNVYPLQMHKNHTYVNPSHTLSSPSKKADVSSDSRPTSNELMNERVSSTDDYKIYSRQSRANSDDNQRNIYDCAVDALVSLSNKHTSVHLPNNQQKNFTESLRTGNATTPIVTSQPGPSNNASNNLYGLNYDCTYAWSIMSQKVKSFSADDLLSKRSRVARPTEAQRLGGILIRNAAHSAGIWKDAPCMHEITVPQKKAFFKFIVSLAPQLSNCQNILFTRLRDALQNRRKYLLDKKLGKVQQRRKIGSSELGLEISEAGSFIDLTDFSADLHDVDSMDAEDLSNDIYIKSETDDDNVTVKSENQIRSK